MRNDKANPEGQPCWQDLFLQLTRGFIEEFSSTMNRNAWVLYLALGTFYNLKQRRAFPTLEQLDAVVPLERYGRSRALGKLVELGLVEVWGEQRGEEGELSTGSYMSMSPGTAPRSSNWTGGRSRS